MRILIADDEAPARSKLRRLLEEIDGIDIVAEVGDGLAALSAMDELKPDVAMLDIQMPGLSGLEVASCARPGPLVVFLTAFEQHGLKAFEVNAADYLLKPYSRERLQASLERMRARLGTMATAMPKAEIYLLKLGNSYRRVELADIRFLEADDNYVHLQMPDGRLTERAGLGEWLTRLGPEFVRVHRSFAVNLRHVERVEPLFKGDADIHLSGGFCVRLSRRFREDFFARFQSG